MGIFAEDSFFDTSGVNLSAHVPTKISDNSQRSGESWIIDNGPEGAVISANNRLRPNAAASVFYRHSGTPGQADYTVSAIHRTTANNNPNGTGIMARLNGTNNGYLFRHSGGVGWQLFRVIAGAIGTAVGTAGSTVLAANTNFAMSMQVVTTDASTVTITCVVDGTTLITLADTNAQRITATGGAGFRVGISNTSTETAGYQFDNFSADDGLSAGQTITANGIAANNLFGSPTTVITVNANGQGASNLFGTPTISESGTGQSITANGIPANNTFGSALFIITATANGIAANNLFGSPVFSQPGASQTITANGIPASNFFGSPTIRNALAYYLTMRQKLFFQHTVDMYKPLAQSFEGFNASEDREYPATPTYSNVQCAYFQTDEMNETTPIGRMNHDIMGTIDKFHFSCDQEIGDGWLIRITTPKIANLTKFWVTLSNPKDRIILGRRRSNTRMVYARRTPVPRKFLG